jgi:arylformamidase
MPYREMDRTALDAAYNNTAAVGQTKRDAYVAGWTRRSQTIRDAPGARLDLRYSVGARQRLDWFRCGAPASPTLIFIHGGYWQRNDKEPYAFLGEGAAESAARSRGHERRALP